MEQLKDYQIENLLNLKASYNGDLGTLQKNTQHSIRTLRHLINCGIIDNGTRGEVFEKYYEIIKNNFITEIKKVLDSTDFYINL